MAISPADVLAVAERSPAAANARDRAAWIGLFAPDGRVEDPVGSRPHVGSGAIGRFYDTFIGPREVAYLPDVDIVSATTVIRDGVLAATLGSVTLRVPIYIRYDVRDVGGELKIAALSAFWELPAMVGEFLRAGPAGLPAGVGLAKALLSTLGVNGTLGFLAGFRGVGAAGKQQFWEFLADARAGNEVAVRRRLGKQARITLGDDTPLATGELLSRLAQASPRKLLASGSHLVVGLDRPGGRDVLLAQAATKPFAIGRIRYFTAAD